MLRKNATHGGGRACYYGKRPKTGSCQPCRTTHARQQTNHNRSRAGRKAVARYRHTARGMLTKIRHAAKQRGVQ